MVILTAIRLEFDAVLKVDAGAVPASAWEPVPGPSGLPVAFRPFVVERGRPLVVAVAVAPDMGATAAVNTLLPLVERLQPRCIAMCGVCAGRDGKVRLGDVVAADRLFYHDTGKQLTEQVQQDLATYKLRDDWKAALEGMDPVARFRDEPWFTARPLTMEWRLWRAMVALRDGVPKPWNAVDLAPGGADEWPLIVEKLRNRKLLARSGRRLTKAGLRYVDDLLFRYRSALPDLSPAGTQHPFRLHVAPIGSGTRVIEDDTIWTFVSQAMRKTLGIEMEAAALGELAHRQRQRKLDAVVMKGVMDYANHGRDDHFKEFAARASAECLLWFLRDHIPTEARGFDDVLTTGTLPAPTRDPAPSVLLNARHAVVPWHEAGRSEVLASLDAWADDPALALALRLLHAEGGVGKTRLAIEWVRRRRELYDVAGFLKPNPGVSWLEKLCGIGTPVIIVVDYAESRVDLVAVLQHVAEYRPQIGTHRRVRVLLLARNDGDWWKALPQYAEIGALVSDGEVIKLLPLAATATEREAVFVEASRRFASVRRRPPVLRSPISLGDARFQRVLYLHMAALAAVEGLHTKTPQATAAAEQVGFDAGSLMNEILEHEERFWRRQGGDRAVATVDVRLARRLLAAATLRGGLSTENEAQEMCERLERRPRSRDDDALVALLHGIYDGGDSVNYLPALEPDLLGEGLVLRVAAPPAGAGSPAGDAWIERVVIAGDDPQALTSAFTVLGRASATSSKSVRPWIANLLRSELPARAVLALRAGKAVGRQTASSTLGDLLAEALEQNGSPSIALELEQEGIPHPTVSLRRVAEWQVRIRLEHAPVEDNDLEALDARAALLLEQGRRLSDLGRHEPALAATREAVVLYRALAMSASDVFQPHLAGSLNNLGNKLSALGQHKLAFAATREAVDLYRALATYNPDAFQPHLARSLLNLGSDLSDAGLRDSALSATREAVEIRRALATRDPEKFQPDLANSLNSLGVDLSALGQREPALTAIRESVDLYRGLATRYPDAFQPDLARTLNNLGATLSAHGQREPATAATREAVELYRALSMRHPEAFEAYLATSLNNLGHRLSELCEHEVALTATQEAVDICRALATRNPEAFQADIARSLNHLGFKLSDVGQREPALSAAREAVSLFRDLATRNAFAFQPELATSLSNLAVRLSDVRQHDEALVVIREAVELHRYLADAKPGAFEPGLARSLSKLGAMLSETGQREPALEAIRESADLYRHLARRNPDTFEPGLAESLSNLGARLSALGRHEPALAATRETVGMYRVLARRNPDAFEPSLAENLGNLAVTLSVLGQPETAFAATREAVGLYRALAIRKPELATGLTNLGTVLSDLGQREAALAAPQEAVDVHRTLAARDPDAFQPDLAGSLSNVSLIVNAQDNPEPALASLREAVEFYRRLATTRGDRFTSALAKSLNDLGIMLSARQEWEPALAAAGESVDLYRGLVARDPAFELALAMSLGNLGAVYTKSGHRDLALAATGESVDLFRALAKHNPPAFRFGLATSLMNLATVLNNFGQREAALAPIGEAVDLYRTLATDNPATFRPDLARSLNALGEALSALGQRDRALAALAEAMDFRPGSLSSDP